MIFNACYMTRISLTPEKVWLKPNPIQMNAKIRDTQIETVEEILIDFL
jgi:hypothetical protein